MSAVDGRVVVRETGIGVKGLMVSLYGSAPAAESPQAPTRDTASRLRIGSVLTGPNGTFHFTYDSATLNSVARQSVDITVVVTAPDTDLHDEEDTTAGSLAWATRRRAGVAEVFVLRVGREELLAAGIPPPRTEPDTNDTVAKLAASRQRARQLDEATGRFFAEDVRAERDLRQRATQEMGPFLAALSGVSKEQREAGRRFVAQGSSVHEANRAAMRSMIEGRINAASLSGRLGLSDEQASALKDENGRFLQHIEPGVIEALLKPKSLASLVGLARLDLSRLCSDTPVDDCIKKLQDDEGTEPAEPVVPPDEGTQPNPPAPITSMVESDVATLLGRLLTDMAAPESLHTLGEPTRSNLEDVEQSVKAFSLHSGPADVPAFHDFHHVRIAFESVWSELFDADVEGKGAELYEMLVEVGEDPNSYLAFNDGFILKPKKKKKGKKSSGSKADNPPEVVAAMFDIAPEQWRVLPGKYQEELEELAEGIRRVRLMPLTEELEVLPGIKFTLPVNETELRSREKTVAFLREQGNRLIRYADHLVMTPDHLDRFHEVLGELTDALKEPYRFSVFAANRFERSVNFGVVATYRQVWTPVTYQVGQLIKTVPLAPKETRKFTKKWAVRQNRAEKEAENSLQARRTEATETARSETSILEKATRKTNFQMSAQGGVDIAIAEASASSAFAHEAATESQEAKKEFREAVFKAAEEYKQERSLEINVTDFTETQGEEAGEITNPNDELPVTYLFYELQRRYRVNEHLRRVTPVVLVAQEMPKPSDIDDAWIVAHDWILRRVILDDSFIPAMNYLASKVVGDEFALEELYKNVLQQRRIVDELKEELVSIRGQSERRYAALQRSLEERAEAIEIEEDGGDIIPMPVGFVFGGEEASEAAMQVREEAARDAYTRMARMEKDIASRLEREVTALSAASEAHTKMLAEHLNRRAQIARLRVHLKSNILYYMQAIWSHEPPDQRYFRLHEVPVPVLKGKKSYTLEEDPDGVPSPPDWKPPVKIVMKCELDTDLEFEPLEVAADLDNLLGFKGNYMMFPLKKPNALTDFMMLPYVDPATGLRDPDPAATWSVSEFSNYVCCLKSKLSHAAFEKLRPRLLDFYLRLMQTPREEEEELVVPTDSLFIEALPGAHPILEDFKLLHRAVDVKKVQAEVRGVELENIRMAARLLSGEREDPTIEKKVIVEGPSSVVVPPDA
jgi:hypothetical protein